MARATTIGRGDQARLKVWRHDNDLDVHDVIRRIRSEESRSGYR